jgi:DNA mismatch repair protein MutL
MDLPAVNSRVERIQQLFGKDIVKDLLPVQFDSPVVSITGFISRPTLTRNNAQQIYFFVNDRYIKNRVLHTAMINGYRNLLPTRRYPVVFLYFDIDPTEIDINVHPTKQEVKFSREDALYSATYGAIRDTWDTREEAKQETQQIFDDLKKEPAPARPWPKSVRDEKRASDLARRPPEVLSLPPAGPVQTPVPLPSRQDPPCTVDQNPVAGPKPAAPGHPPRGTGDPLPPGSAPAPVQDTPTAPPPQAVPAPRAMAEPTQALDAMIHSPKQDALFEVKSIEDEGQLKVVGQLMNNYILAEGRGGLFIIDQHAAHERLKFEEFLIQSQKARLASQDLLFPLTLDFTPAEAAILDESLTILAQLGFEIEAFGPRTYLVRSLPASLQFEAAEEFIKDILGEIQNEGSVQEKKERALHTLACKAAVKFGDPLRHEDMEAILRGLEKIPRRNVCPHGRPVVLHVSDDQLRTLFKRTGF